MRELDRATEAHAARVDRLRGRDCGDFVEPPPFRPGRIGADGRCRCYDPAFPCPLGKVGAMYRCTEAELRAADAGARFVPLKPCCRRVGMWWCTSEQGHGGECTVPPERELPSSDFTRGRRTP